MEEPKKLEYDYKLLSLLEEQPSISQREMARQLGLSVGKINFVLNALLDKGWLKASNFKRSNNKMGYIYALTPSGIVEKTKITARFLQSKLQEYDTLAREIEEIKSRIDKEHLDKK